MKPRSSTQRDSDRPSNRVRREPSASERELQRLFLQCKRKQDALLGSEARLGAVFRSLVEGVLFLNQDGDIEMTNDAVRRLHWQAVLALNRARRNRRWRVIRGDGSPFPVDEQPVLQALRSGRPVRNVEMGIPTRTKGYTWRLVNAQPVRDPLGRTLGAVASFIDITERKLSEQALQDAEQRQRAMFQQASDAIVVFDPETLRFLEFNNEVCRFLGYTRREFEKLRLKDIDVIESPKTIQKHAQQVIQKGFIVFETRHRTKDGDLREVEVRAAPIRVGNRTLVQAFWRDITDRKRWEKHQRDLASELERQVHQRTTEWREANRLLQQEMKRRRELEGRLLQVSEREQRRIGQDLHDDVCSQLTGIEYMCHSVLNDLAAGTRTAVGKVRRITRLLRTAMDDARRLARGLSPLPLDDEGLIMGLRDLAVRTRTVYRCQCVFRGDPHALIPDGTKALHLYRIAQEAVTNAIQHGQARRIVISLHARDGGVIMRVRDHGSGLAETSSRTRGLGLIGMEVRAGAMGGSLAVRRCAPKGTEVICTVPRCLRRSSEGKTR